MFFLMQLKSFRHIYTYIYIYTYKQYLSIVKAICLNGPLRWIHSRAVAVCVCVCTPFKKLLPCSCFYSFPEHPIVSLNHAGYCDPSIHFLSCALSFLDVQLCYCARQSALPSGSILAHVWSWRSTFINLVNDSYSIYKYLWVYIYIYICFFYIMCIAYIYIYINIYYIYICTYHIYI